MANHGKCERCWWFKEQLGLTFPTDSGDCYMQNDNQGRNCKEVSRFSYCPDYINRKKWNNIFKQTLEDWIKEKFGN